MTIISCIYLNSTNSNIYKIKENFKRFNELVSSKLKLLIMFFVFISMVILFLLANRSIEGQMNRDGSHEKIDHYVNRIIIGFSNLDKRIPLEKLIEEEYKDILSQPKKIFLNSFFIVYIVLSVFVPFLFYWTTRNYCNFLISILLTLIVIDVILGTILYLTSLKKFLAQYFIKNTSYNFYKIQRDLLRIRSINNLHSYFDSLKREALNYLVPFYKQLLNTVINERVANNHTENIVIDQIVISICQYAETHTKSANTHGSPSIVSGLLGEIIQTKFEILNRADILKLMDENIDLLWCILVIIDGYFMDYLTTMGSFKFQLEREDPLSFHLLKPDELTLTGFNLSNVFSVATNSYQIICTVERGENLYKKFYEYFSNIKENLNKMERILKMKGLEKYSFYVLRDWQLNMFSSFGFTNEEYFTKEKEFLSMFSSIILFCEYFYYDFSTYPAFTSLFSLESEIAQNQK